VATGACEIGQIAECCSWGPCGVEIAEIDKAGRNYFSAITVWPFIEG